MHWSRRPLPKKRNCSVHFETSKVKKEIGRVTDLVGDLGGVQRTQRLAKSYIEKALGQLKGIPESMYKDLLCAWADFMISRQF